MIAIFNISNMEIKTWHTNRVKRMSYLVGLQANKLNINRQFPSKNEKKTRSTLFRDDNKEELPVFYEIKHLFILLTYIVCSSKSYFL